MTGNTHPFGRNAFLVGLASELDPPVVERRLARERYRDLGDWLKLHAADGARDIEVYPQGSGNLGTTNRDPFTGEFDIDLVVRVAYAKQEITQQELNELVNGWLGSYVSARQREDHPLAPKALSRGKRAWTLYYERFHMDVLPVVPDVYHELLALLGDPSWLTDKTLRLWQPTNPRGFAEWFRTVSSAEFYERKVALAKRADVNVDDLPDDDVTTTLQMAVRLLKRHRDTMFRDDPDKLAPPSALITALAATAYAVCTPGGGEIADVLEQIVVGMPDGIGRTSAGDLLVVNPTCEEENYADRYQGRMDKEEALHGWLKQAAVDLGAINTAHGAHVVTKRIDAVFGAGLGARVAKRLGLDAQQMRGVGAVAATGTGLLRVDPPSAHRQHKFYGDPQA